MICYILRYVKVVFIIGVCFIDSTQCKLFEVLDPSYDKENIKIIKKSNGRHVYVARIEDQLYKKKYCVKQYHLTDRIFLSLKEVLISRIAESVGIPVNCVRLIPAKTLFPGKCYEKRIATLHTFIPGKSLRGSGDYPEVDIKQFSQGRKIFGITIDIINNMSLSLNLAQIVALDTFTGSTNHSRGNIFFDKESNDFYGIDLKRAFLKNLGNLAYENVKKMNAGKKFTSRQIDALRIYRDTLKELIAKNPPGDICRHLDAVIKAGQLKRRMCFFGDKYVYLLQNKFVPLTSNSVKECKVMIFQNYDSAKKLVMLLDEIIKKYTK